MPAAIVVALAGCAALSGAHPGDVIVKATPIRQEAGWVAPTDQKGYRPEPVKQSLCRVEGTIEGNIGFELWLPEEWNGRLLGAGVGGDAGIYNYVDMSRRIAEGFATVTTDSGHKASQARWMADRKARVDYEHRAVHLTAQAAKMLAARFYGRDVDRSYFVGCSGGGRQALKEMQNYPADYDGVIAGAPGPYMPLQSVRMLWFALQQKAKPDAALTDADWSLYENAVTRACDGDDGVRDGVIANPLSCRFQTRALLCKPGEHDGCLTAPKLEMLNQIIAPMKDEQGRVMDDGLLPGVRTRPGPPSPLLRAMWADGVYGDPDWNEDGFMRARDLAQANRVMPELRADKLSISPFVQRGGKAILWQGWADPSTNAGPTIDYYAALTRAHGGMEALGSSVRLFLAPGVYHCGGGPGADQAGGSGQRTAPGDPSRDMVWALIDWVEKGNAPASLVAGKVEEGRELFTRKLCPFPQAAQYDGKGPQERASSYQCRDEPTLRTYAKRRSLVGS